MKNKRGYTVVEILGVTTILLILLVILLPMVFVQIQKARDSAAFSTLNNIVSMYRMSGTMLKDQDISYKKSGMEFAPVVLPIKDDTVVTSEYEREVNLRMNEAFSSLKEMDFVLTHTTPNEVTGLTVKYRPDIKKEIYYLWVDGTVYRINPNNEHVLI